VAQRTNPPGRAGVGVDESCPGDVIGRPSQGCLKRTHLSGGNLKDVYAYFDGLLAQYGYTTQNASPEPYANLQLGKWVSDVFGSFTVRSYPDVRQPDHYRQINLFLRQLTSGQTQAEITFTVKNGPAAASAPPQAARKNDDRLSFPPPRGTWKWALQSVAVKVESKIQYSTFYYEASTDRSVEKPLPLPSGGSIVGVFPDDCTFSVQDQTGRSFTFKNQDEAKGKTLSPGYWSLFPIKCGGVVLFVK